MLQALTGQSGASHSRLWPSSWPGPSRGARPGAVLGEAGLSGRTESGWEAPPPLERTSPGRFAVRREGRSLWCSGAAVCWRRTMGSCTRGISEERGQELAGIFEARVWRWKPGVLEGWGTVGI